MRLISIAFSSVLLSSIAFSYAPELPAITDADLARVGNYYVGTEAAVAEEILLEKHIILPQDQNERQTALSGALWDAAEQADYLLVKSLVTLGANVLQMDIGGFTVVQRVPLPQDYRPGFVLTPIDRSPELYTLLFLLHTSPNLFLAGTSNPGGNPDLVPMLWAHRPKYFRVLCELLPILVPLLRADANGMQQLLNKALYMTPAYYGDLETLRWVLETFPEFRVPGQTGRPMGGGPREALARGFGAGNFNAITRQQIGNYLNGLGIQD